MTSPSHANVLKRIADLLADVNLFDRVEVKGPVLWCRAKHVESPTYYRVTADHAANKFWVGLYTPDRWLSESIEADLMHVGDHIEELLEEELVEQGLEMQLPVEHFRDDDKQYVFRSPVTPPPDSQGRSPEHGAGTAELLKKVLLGYEATFQPLGDMGPDEE